MSRPMQRSSTAGDLAEKIRGKVLTPDAPGYEDRRHAWNASADRRPSLIASCVSTADVQHAVTFATEHDLPIAVRGGGHSVAGFSTIDGGMLIDLSAMDSVEVDPGARVARAGAGTRIGAFDAATQAHGLATTLGVVSTVGIAGLTLGGGLGWLMRAHGLACDNLRSIEVVTADGTVHTAGPDDDADLLWGMRGGGGNLGIATSLTYGLHEVGPIVYGGFAAFGHRTRRDLLQTYRDLTVRAPDELTAYAALSAAPDGTPVGVLAACYAGPPERGAALLGPARDALGSPLVDQLGPLPYLEQQRLLDPAYPDGQHHYWRSCFVDELSDEVVAVLTDAANEATAPPLLEIVIEHMGGAIRDGDGAFGHRDAGYDILIDANWIDPTDGDRCVRWARDTAAALARFSEGGYANYEPDAGISGARASYGDRWNRMRSLKRRYDPHNVFRANQNVEPGDRSSI